MDVEAEDRRLKAVHASGLLDTDAEQAYDDLVQLAACICQVPISLVTLLDERRIWLKAKVGVPVSEAPRSFSFCQYTIQQDDLFVIPDTLQNPLYAVNAAVTGTPSIRFYAGYPLSTSKGEKLGSLCVLHSEPRELNDNQQVALRVLGRQVMAQIELKQRIQQLQVAMELQETAELALQSSQRLLEVANEQLLQQSLTDPLTGLNNRRSFEAILHSEFQRGNRSNAPLSLLMLDIDLFKSFNDTYGHLQGDHVLSQVGSLVRTGARTGDHIARFGGEEFVVILPDTSGEQALQVATRICTAVSSASWSVRPITVSIGVATRDAETPTPYALVNAADQALYEAKRSGKNRVHASQGQAQHS